MKTSYRFPKKTKCIHCGGELQSANKSGPGTNNRKFCSVACRNEYPPNKEKRTEYMRIRSRILYACNPSAKQKCRKCGGTYTRAKQHESRCSGINFTSMYNY